MANKGDSYECDVCGVEVVCTKDCGCGVSDLVCCGKNMKKTHKKQESIKKK